MSTPISNEPIPFQIQLPEKPAELTKALFPLHRLIEQSYAKLPWPSQMKQILVITNVSGGRGDIAAAAKAIGVMQNIAPEATFDWIVTSGDKHPPIPFLSCKDPSQVHSRHWPSKPSDESQADLLLTGPVPLTWDNNYIERKIQRKIAGPTFGFNENAAELKGFGNVKKAIQIKIASSWLENPKEFHLTMFPASSDEHGQLPMGLEKGSGVFLDRSRIEAPKSRGYCCPTYLSKIEDASLREDILEALGSSEPNYDRYSFNSGYAHHVEVSWGKFIDCVAIHEQDKHVVIVANQEGEFTKLQTSAFCNQVFFTSERVAFLKEKGFGTITLKGKGDEVFTILKETEASPGRKLTILVRPSFTPQDMKYLQLASERLLSTGDNSAVEAWCSRCKLYLYEDVDNAGCKWRFLQQQVDVAQTISPNLSRLLALFGGDRRLPDPHLNTPLNKEKMHEMESLLMKKDLSEATLKFCEHITEHYSFEEVLQSALKRTAWCHLAPELADIESNALGDQFRQSLIDYLLTPQPVELTINRSKLQDLTKQIEEVVEKHIAKKTAD
jgi:hypothetical protein